MSQNKESQKRRERIMENKGKLPGDAARAEAEEKGEDFDAGDTGNFGTSKSGHQAGDPLRRDKVNRSKAELEGDVQRGDDDQRVDEFGEDEQ